ncbi:ABC transporter ATP-binding protein [Natronomonas sp. EA1]|uniref:ABC transporter ATP-binding protein n=1 Tax=Natronomonas sp. EA1 TaxID=3421655 RepID=UPI003EBB6F85
MVIRAANVRRSYGETVALDGVSLEIDAGEVVALIGPNGAGKTTLIRALTGTTRAEGDIEVFGTAPDAVDPQRIGLLPQEFDPAERLTARELIDYYGGLYDHARDTETVLADVGLSERADTYYEHLSGGQKRRVCVGTALVNDPDLLFLDEPTTGIDPVGRRDVWQLVEELAAAGTTVVLTTHYMQEAERLADRVGLLADGELVAVDAPERLVADHGGTPRLEIEARDPDPVANALLSAGYELVPDTRTVVVHDIAPEAIGGVTEVLADAEVEYGALSWRGPDLETVYLNLTGLDVDERGEAVEVPT